MNFKITNDKSINRSLEKFYTKNGYFPTYFNSYNCLEIKDIASTITASCGIQNSIGCILVIEEVSDE